MNDIQKVQPIVPHNKTPYLDPTPAGQMSVHRAHFIMAAKDMLENGKLNAALKLAICADSLIGKDINTFTGVHEKDSTFRTRYEMASLYKILADSLEAKINNKPVYLRERAAQLKADEDKIIGEWLEYKRTLSPDLRLKMSK